MAYDEALADRLRQVFEGQEGIRERKMFGGLAFMLHGNMCCGVERGNLMVRVGPDRYDEALDRPHARVMDFTGRPMTGFVYVSQEGISTAESLTEWVGLAVAFAETLPRK